MVDSATTDTTGSKPPDTTSTMSRSENHKAPEETVHMSVLGMDGTDLQVDQASAKRPASTKVPEDVVPSGPVSPPNTSQVAPNAKSPPLEPATTVPTNVTPVSTPTKSSWWGNMVWGDQVVAAGGDLTPADEKPKRYRSLSTPLGRSGYAEVKPTPGQPTSLASAVAKVAPASNSVEDQLKQDCGFFYQGMEDSSERHGQSNGGLKPLSTALDKVPRALDSRAGAMFHARYDRLNQELARLDSDDLILDEYDETTARSPTVAASETIEFNSIGSPNIIDVYKSSLCYEQNGRLLMRLPRDQMRLIMDQDLEPGIISVEQWRQKDGKSDPNLPEGDEEAPPLRYVMTVPDDLYRRVVAEMSYSLQPPCWGFFKCFEDGGTADIKLALGIIFVVLFLMFISTMEWKGQ